MVARYVVHLARERRIEDRGTGDTPPVLVTLERHIAAGNSWLAKVEGIDEDAPGGFDQAFLDPIGDTLGAMGNGTRLYAIDRDGVYQAHGVWKGFEAHRVVLRIQDGAVEIIAASSDGFTPAKLRDVLYVALTGAAKPRKARAKKEAVTA